MENILSPPLITLGRLTRWGHSLGSFQHVDPLPSPPLLNDHRSDEVGDADDSDGDDIYEDTDDAQLKKSSWNMWWSEADNQTTEWWFSRHKYNFFPTFFTAGVDDHYMVMILVMIMMILMMIMMIMMI